MIDPSHCATGLHCVDCRANPAAYDAPKVCTYKGPKMASAEDIKAKEAAYHALLREISDHCKACEDKDICDFMDKRSCERRRLIRQKAAECPDGKWSVKKK